MNDDPGNAFEVIEAYYDALDTHDADRLRDVLDPAFVQERPDRTFEDRESFVRFMREDRPNPHTSHAIDSCTLEDDAVVVEGRLLEATSADRELLSFVDRFTLEDGVITHLETMAADE